MRVFWTGRVLALAVLLPAAGCKCVLNEEVQSVLTTEYGNRTTAEDLASAVTSYCLTSYPVADAPLHIKGHRDRYEAARVAVASYIDVMKGMVNANYGEAFMEGEPTYEQQRKLQRVKQDAYNKTDVFIAAVNDEMTGVGHVSFDDIVSILKMLLELGWAINDASCRDLVSDRLEDAKWQDYSAIEARVKQERVAGVSGP